MFDQMFLSFFWLSLGLVGVEIKYIKIYAINLQAIPSPMRRRKFVVRLSLIPSCFRGSAVP